MFYSFPHITDIEQVRVAIAGKDEFKEVDKGDHIIFNYLVNFTETFPDPWEKFIFPIDGEKFVLNEKSTILRECRGLVFDKQTGKVISRRFHKFFNLNEKPETNIDHLSFMKPHMILEKLDGSMIAPYMTSDGKLYIGTKMGDTDTAKGAAAFINKPENRLLRSFIDITIGSDRTPIFEWCSRKNRIVVDYPTDRLVLTAIRHNVTGKYTLYKDMCEIAKEFNVEVVKAIDGTFTTDILNQLTTLEDAEGYVIRFEDGHMIKVKGAWYVQLHRLMDTIKNEKDVIPLILAEKLDDAIPFFADDLAEQLEDYANQLLLNIGAFSNGMCEEFKVHYYFAHQKAHINKSNHKKEFAELVKADHYKSLLFKMFDFRISERGKTEYLEDFTYQLIKDYVLSNCTNSKLENIREIIGTEWIF